MDKFWQAANLRAALLTAVAGVATATPALSQEHNRTQSFDIATQNTASALTVFARQANVQILFPQDVAARWTSPPLRGSYAVEAALVRLIQGTDLSIVSNNGATIVLAGLEGQAAEPAAPAASEESDDSNQSGRLEAQSEEIVVVGTNIRGIYPDYQPTEVFDLQDIQAVGSVTLDNFVEKVTQNFGTRRAYGSFASGQPQFEGVNGLDLRGLGVGTTLTLLNGRRLALASNGQVADVSLIPLSALDRVEVLTDGASAIYGSDAVGGVVNFVLRDSFDGAETKATYGGVTQGNLTQGSISQTYGRSWRTGNVLGSYEYYSASALETSDRSYSTPAGPGLLSPVDQRQGAFVTIEQDLGERVTLSGDVLFSNRDVKNFGTRFGATQPATNNQRFDSKSETSQYFVNLGAELRFTDTLVGSVLASYSDIDVNSDTGTTTFSTAPTAPPGVRTPFSRDTAYSALDVTAKLDGELFKLGGGALQFSIGGGLVDEEYLADRVFSSASAVSGKQLGRTTTYAFGELFAPIFGPDQAIPGMHRLEISVAARYTGYEDESQPAILQDFGSKTSPKIGVLWAPAEGFNVRATYGESFRAPTLAELDPTLVASALVTTTGTAPPAPAVVLSGPSPDLKVEESQSWTAGLDVQPGGEDGPRFSVTYFNVEYLGRIGLPPTAQARLNPAAFPDIYFHPTSAAQIEEFLRQAPPASSNIPGITPPFTNLQATAAALFALPNLWIVNNRARNFSQTYTDGFDVSIADHFETGVGGFDIGLQATRILEFKEQATNVSPVVSGTDIVLNPADFRGRLFGTYSIGGFSTSFNVNYVDDYVNPLPAGSAAVDSWTTLDWSTRYEFEGEDGLLPGFALTLSVQNVFDEDPPFVQRNDNALVNNSLGFDPTNANPLGRFVVFSVSKTW